MVKFKRSAKFRKVWGEDEPPVLVQAFNCLDRLGYVGPASWDDPKSLKFEKNIDEDLFVTVSIIHEWECPVGEIHFDTSIAFKSRYIDRVDQVENFSGREFSQIVYDAGERGSALWTFSLSHLKWNEIEGRIPKWFVPRPGVSCGNTASDWVEDWMEFGQPYVDGYSIYEAVINELMAGDNFVASPWCKSDGPRKISPIENAAILLSRIRRFDLAFEIAAEFTRVIKDTDESTRADRAFISCQARATKLINWLERQRNN